MDSMFTGLFYVVSIEFQMTDLNAKLFYVIMHVMHANGISLCVQYYFLYFLYLFYNYTVQRNRDRKKLTKIKRYNHIGTHADTVNSISIYRAWAACARLYLAVGIPSSNVYITCSLYHVCFNFMTKTKL